MYLSGKSPTFSPSSWMRAGIAASPYLLYGPPHRRLRPSPKVSAPCRSHLQQTNKVRKRSAFIPLNTFNRKPCKFNILRSTNATEVRSCSRFKYNPFTGLLASLCVDDAMLCSTEKTRALRWIRHSNIKLGCYLILFTTINLLQLTVI